MEHSLNHHKAPDLICSMPEKRLRKDYSLTSSSGLFLKLTNQSENHCFANSVVRILQQTDVMDFLLTQLPELEDPSISTAQELARLYRSIGEQSAKHLCRYSFNLLFFFIKQFPRCNALH